jgi:hypothetical protein
MWSLCPDRSKRRGWHDHGMAVIETLSFTLAGHIPEDEFLRLDAAVQEDFAYQQRGLERRTTARGDGGTWLVLTWWGDAECAVDAAAASDVSEPVAKWRAAIELSSMQSASYTTL